MIPACKFNLSEDSFIHTPIKCVRRLWDRAWGIKLDEVEPPREEPSPPPLKERVITELPKTEVPEEKPPSHTQLPSKESIAVTWKQLGIGAGSFSAGYCLGSRWFPRFLGQKKFTEEAIADQREIEVDRTKDLNDLKNENAVLDVEIGGQDKDIAAQTVILKTKTSELKTLKDHTLQLEGEITSQQRAIDSQGDILIDKTSDLETLTDDNLQLEGEITTQRLAISAQKKEEIEKNKELKALTDSILLIEKDIKANGVAKIRNEKMLPFLRGVHQLIQQEMPLAETILRKAMAELKSVTSKREQLKLETGKQEALLRAARNRGSGDHLHRLTGDVSDDEEKESNALFGKSVFEEGDS
ncbi:MAG: hypothetical protein K1060chlam2_01201 [Chlamydiae bacterium]|nr:hypothetical protein [Chlamydiota bacterium]